VNCVKFNVHNISDMSIAFFGSDPTYHHACTTRTTCHHACICHHACHYACTTCHHAVCMHDVPSCIYN